jgi:uncharacterized protein (UPF0332 family)
LKEEARLHFERANDCIEDSQVLFDGGRFAAAAERAYYAMLHSASAVLLDKGIERHSHQGVISAFGQFLVKPGLISEEFHRYFIESFDIRQESDYEPVAAVSKEQAQKIITRANEFVKACRKICNLQ